MEKLIKLRKWTRITFLVLAGVCSLTGCRLSGSKEQPLSEQDFTVERAAAESAENVKSSESSESTEENQKDPGLLSLQEDPLWSDEKSLNAMVISDLHYTEKKNLDHTLVPGIAEAERITDAVIAEIIDRHPDVLIMTGDNTNSGYAKDVSGLISKLQKIRDNGIQIIMTTGNHDFDQMDAEEYEKAYFRLLDPVDRDPASLSYTAIIKDVVFLAMDDHNTEADWQGSFSEKTMQWIRDMLDKYSGYTVIFLSHHNVLYGFEEEHGSLHLIQNPELPQLLHAGGVKLAMTGHMHLQYITEKDGLWEILSGMPFSGRHLIGSLAVGKNRIIYYAEPVNFAVYGRSVKEKLNRLDQESSEYLNQVFSELLDAEGLPGPRKKRVMNLINWYFYYYDAGTLADHKQKFTKDPFYKRMIRSLWNYNYGPWMKAMIETTQYNAGKLDISW